MLSSHLVLIKGAGDLASGIAHRLHRSGFFPVMTELENPLVVRRAVAFASAVWRGSFLLEGVTACKEKYPERLDVHRKNRTIPVFIDPDGTLVDRLKPEVLIDATMAKKNTGVSLEDAPIVIGVGPGFEAGLDVHAVVETMRGHSLGKVILQGKAAPNTGVPGEIGGFRMERLLLAPVSGVFTPVKQIGDLIEADQVIAWIGDTPVRSQIKGVLRGLLYEGVVVREGLKVGDVDPRAYREYCFTISDKARAVAGGVLEAALFYLHSKGGDDSVH